MFDMTHTHNEGIRKTFKKAYKKNLKNLLSVASLAADPTRAPLSAYRAALLVKACEREAANKALRTALKKQGEDATEVHKAWLNREYPKSG
tara:strand:- start:610 stop:882 length:273 start_codon:yes stop_codon:yes gene_type:complete